MRNDRISRLIVIGMAAALVLGALSLGGCKKSTTNSQAPASQQATAKAGFKTAQSVLSTTAPEAQLLLVQTAQVVTATETPVWEYIVGSPKTDKLYAIVVSHGLPQAQEYGAAELGSEWSKVPSADAWKIDSDEALAKARAVYPNAKADTAYAMGMITYIPEAKKKPGSKAMTWFVQFDPQTQGSLPTSTVQVDATTGEASLAK